MKIRSDFVSNSSSTSFMLVGDVFDNAEIISAWEQKTGKNANDEEYDVWECLHELCHGLQYERGLDNYYDQYVIGLSWDDIKPDETKAQFEARVKDLLDREFPERDNQVECRVDGGHD